MKKIFFTFFCVFLFSPVFVFAADVGDKADFFLDEEYDYAGRTKITATLRHVSKYAYFYFEDAYFDSLQQIDKNSIAGILSQAASSFDEKTYPTETSILGFERKPGLDNDNHVVILFTHIKEGAGGYFTYRDMYAKNQDPLSNEKEMFYINALYMKHSRLNSFIAHEFQHLISFNQKDFLRGLMEDIWLNEARSEYMPALCGFEDPYRGSNLERRVEAFMDNPSDALMEWSNSKEDYASAALFMHYLTGRFGSGILTRMMQSANVGIASIDDALAFLGSDKKFIDVFGDWAVTNLLNDCSVSSKNVYCYYNPELNASRLKISFGSGESVGASAQLGYFTKDWTAQWYQFDISSMQDGDNSTLKLSFESDSPAADFRVPYVLESGGKSTVYQMPINKNKGTVYVKDFGVSTNKITVIPYSGYKKSGFGTSENQISYSINAGLVDCLIEKCEASSEIDLSAYSDGTLIKLEGDYRVYIVKGGYKRWIQNPDIMSAYEHFKWSGIKTVNREIFNAFQDAWLVRAEGDYKVYEINGDGTKHWLNISAEKFSASGRDWGMIYEINKKEFELYKAGADVM